VEPPPPAQPAAIEGRDVLQQVGELVGNAGYSKVEALALVQAAARYMARQ
jgi:hypothetical protein